tara:strand:+ start:354 stop:1298 length:945 start_codon:yes stop_codon:yes gene_type:complete
MDNLKKVGLTALAGSLVVAGHVSAAEMSVSGSATMSYNGGDEDKTEGQGWTMGDSVTFSASGDVNDIGVTYSVELDGDAAAGGGGVDNYSLAFDLGDAGSLTFAGHGGSGFMDANDDVMPTAHEEPWDVVTSAETQLIGGHAGDNMFTYKYSHDSGLNLTVGYLNAADAVTDVSYTDYGVTYTGMEGLTLGYGQGDVEQTTNTKSDESTMFAKYAIGQVTVGIQMSEKDNESGNDYETTGVGISYQVNDDLAVSYGSHITEVDGSNPDQEASAISVSYTMGSLSMSLSMHQVDNINNVATNDREAYNVSLGFAF